MLYALLYEFMHRACDCDPRGVKPLAYYVPFMLNLRGRRCVTVGGGHVAERKVIPLLDSGADIVVISPELTGTLHQRYEEGRLHWMKRKYQSGDLNDAFLVFAATNQSEVNDAVVQEANSLNIPVNHTGDGEKGSFITPSVLRRQELIVAVSTSGAGPRASRDLCRNINEHYGDDYEAYIHFLNSVRSEVKKMVRNDELRKKIFRLLSEMDVLSQISAGAFREWDQDRIRNWIEQVIAGRQEEK
ncbi:Precorrin-2 dehydrogenase [compost metagenome]